MTAQGHRGLSLLPSADMPPVHPPVPSPVRLRRAAAACSLVVLLMVAATVLSTTPASSTEPTALAPPPAVAWTSCPGSPTIQCGSVRVPVDYRHPQGATIAIAVERAPALGPGAPRGTMLFNPGGPGESGNQILPVALAEFPATVRRSFNIVSFDARGTGASDPLRCGTSPSEMASVDPVPVAANEPLPGAAAFTAMAKACEQRARSLAPFINTTNTARDMDRIREALGLAKVSFYGLSYGTVLGAVYADLFPRHVATMVLDGAVDVNASLIVQAEQEAPAAEQSLQHLLATCGSVAPCPLGPDPTSYFRALSVSIRRHPLPAPGDGDDYPVTAGDLDTATLFALSVPEFTGQFLKAVVDAHDGNGAPLRVMSLGFDTDIDGAPLVDPLWAITCNDAAVHPGPIQAGNLARTLDSRYPIIGGYAATYAMGGCVAWPRSAEPVTDLHPEGTPPILVIGNTGDPNTPLVGARHLAAIFPKAGQLTWRGWGHTWLLSGSADVCMQQAVTKYLSGGGLPPAGTVCH
jgi:pimeloyl-ACP methyl ester carboxylesterase